jgi:S1-C subfamily serine protease
LRVLESTVGLTVEERQGRLVVARVAGGSLAERRGLRSGDLILGANGQELSSAELLGREVLRGLDRGGLLLAVGRGRYVYNLDFPL